MYDNILNLLIHGDKVYRKGNKNLFELGRAATNQIKDIFVKYDDIFRDSGLFKNYFAFKKKAQWQRGHGPSKITTYFAYIIKNNNYPNIGSSIGIYYGLDEENRLQIETSITMEYDQEDEIFDPIIQNELAHYERGSFIFQSRSNNRHKWKCLVKKFEVSLYNCEDSLLNDIKNSVLQLAKIFDSIVKNIKDGQLRNEENNYVYSTIENPTNEEINHVNMNAPGFVDSIKKAKDDKDIGNYFENEVLKAEIKRLESINIHNRPRKVDGDSYGYDIVSFDENGDEIYIEVKGTRKNCSTPFYITINEIQAARQYKNKWILYRVYKENTTVYIKKITANDLLSNLLNQPYIYEIKLG